MRPQPPGTCNVLMIPAAVLSPKQRYDDLFEAHAPVLNEKTKQVEYDGDAPTQLWCSEPNGVPGTGYVKNIASINIDGQRVTGMLIWTWYPDDRQVAGWGKAKLDKNKTAIILPVRWEHCPETSCWVGWRTDRE